MFGRPEFTFVRSVEGRRWGMAVYCDGETTYHVGSWEEIKEAYKSLPFRRVKNTYLDEEVQASGYRYDVDKKILKTWGAKIKHVAPSSRQ